MCDESHHAKKAPTTMKRLMTFNSNARDENLNVMRAPTKKIILRIVDSNASEDSTTIVMIKIMLGGSSNTELQGKPRGIIHICRDHANAMSIMTMLNTELQLGTIHSINVHDLAMPIIGIRMKKTSSDHARAHGKTTRSSR